MQQLIYISTACAEIDQVDITRILAVSRRNNARDGITGLLIHDGRRFLQALEGYAPLVDAAFARIKADTRHRAAVMLSCRKVAAAEFGHWAMASEAVSRTGRDGSLSDVVDGLVAQVTDKNTRALFSSFARIDRSAA